MTFLRGALRALGVIGFCFALGMSWAACERTEAPADPPADPRAWEACWECTAEDCWPAPCKPEPARLAEEIAL